MKRYRTRAPYGNKSKKSKRSLIKAKTSKSFTKTGPTSNQLPVQLLYVDTYNLNPGVGGAGQTQTFRLGSLNDPDFSGIGHQPMGHDDVSNMFERYQVWKVDFEIEFVFPVASTNTNAVGVSYRVSDTSSTSTDPRVNLESGAGEWGSVTSCQTIKKFSGTVLLSDIHGVSYKQYMSNDDYGANFGNNPVEDCYLHLFVDGYDGDTLGIKARARLTYHAKLMGNKLQALS